MLKVLIAEDELMIADLLEQVLAEQGFEVCGIARTVAEAVALGELHKPDVAILDVRLARGGHGPEIARRLKCSRPLGVLYATGERRNSNLAASDGEAVIRKPYRLEDVGRALEIVHEMVTGGTPAPPYPVGFQLLAKFATPTAASSA
jgi:DNA-binding response OmpR family regulator